MKEWYLLILVYVSTKFGGGSLIETWRYYIPIAEICVTNFLNFT